MARQNKPPPLISSPRNPAVQRIRRAIETGKLAGGCVAAEGWRLLEEALRSPGCEIDSLFATEAAHGRLRRMLTGAGVQARITLVTERAFRSMAGTETPQGVAALVKLPQRSPGDAFKSPDAVVLVLAGIQDPGNLGTILRSAEAFGAAACLLSTGCASPYNAKAVRASAGSIFRAPVFPRIAPEKAVAACRAAGARCVALVAGEGAALEQLPAQGRIALFLGSEARGLPDSLLAQMDERARIRLDGPVESLNAAVAASVALYEISRKRRAEQKTEHGTV